MTLGIRTAFVMGAGLGKRLRPLTDSRPKPLVPVFGKPLVTFVMDHLRAAGVERFVVNTHHRAERWADFFPDGQYAGCAVELIYEPELLETGGGIANAADRLVRAGEEAFFVYSGDVLTDLDLARLAGEHARAGNSVTLALRETGLAAGIACRDGRVIDVGGRYGEPGEYDFANVSVWTAEAVSWLPEARRKVPFVPVLAERIAEGGRVGGVILNDGQWFNVGTRSEYLRVHAEIAAGGWRPEYLTDAGWPMRVDASAVVAKSARLEGVTVVGAGSRIGEGAVVRDSVIWDGAEVTAGARVDGCVVCDFAIASGTRVGEDCGVL